MTTALSSHISQKQRKVISEYLLRQFTIIHKTNIIIRHSVICIALTFWQESFKKLKKQLKITPKLKIIKVKVINFDQVEINKSAKKWTYENLYGRADRVRPVRLNVQYDEWLSPTMCENCEDKDDDLVWRGMTGLAWAEPGDSVLR